MKSVKIIGTGHSLPEQIVDNFELEKRMETSNEIILKKTGVEERRHVKENENLSSLMVDAAQKAILKSGINVEEIDLLLVNTLSPDFHDPSQACLIQKKIGLRNIPSFDIRAQCSGLLYGFEIASNMIKSGGYRNALVICGEILSKKIDYSKAGRNLSVLLGDGAGAVVLSQENSLSPGFKDILIKADGDYFDLLHSKKPGSQGDTYLSQDDVEKGLHFFRLNGQPMFEHASTKMCEITREILNKHQLSIDDIDFVIPHQPNLRLLEYVLNELNVPKEKVHFNVQKYGNMASASLAVTLSEVLEIGCVKPGDRILFLSYGSGATWGAAIYEH